jgi:hypothetical protein
MTLREARSVARRFMDVNSTITAGQLYYACTTLLRALSRPTRLEREAARYLGTLPWVSHEMVSWLARYEAKRKRKP